MTELTSKQKATKAVREVSDLLEYTLRLGTVAEMPEGTDTRSWDLQLQLRNSDDIVQIQVKFLGSNRTSQGILQSQYSTWLNANVPTVLCVYHEADSNVYFLDLYRYVAAHPNCLHNELLTINLSTDLERVQTLAERTTFAHYMTGISSIWPLVCSLGATRSCDLRYPISFRELLETPYAFSHLPLMHSGEDLRFLRSPSVIDRISRGSHCFQHSRLAKKMHDLRAFGQHIARSFDVAQYMLSGGKMPKPAFPTMEYSERATNHTLISLFPHHVVLDRLISCIHKCTSWHELNFLLSAIRNLQTPPNGRFLYEFWGSIAECASRITRSQKTLLDQTSTMGNILLTAGMLGDEPSVRSYRTLLTAEKCVEHSIATADQAHYEYNPKLILAEFEHWFDYQGDALRFIRDVDSISVRNYLEYSKTLKTPPRKGRVRARNLLYDLLQRCFNNNAGQSFS